MSWPKSILIIIPPAVLSKVLHRGKTFSEHFVDLAHKLNHKLMQIRILSIVNNNLAPFKIQVHFSLKNK